MSRNIHANSAENEAQLHMHMKRAFTKTGAFMCGDLNMQERRAGDGGRGGGGLDEGISLSLGSRRAVMYKACVDIV